MLLDKKTEFYRHFFSKNEAQINENNYSATIFMSKLVSLPKISSIVQNIKISPKLQFSSMINLV